MFIVLRMKVKYKYNECLIKIPKSNRTKSLLAKVKKIMANITLHYMANIVLETLLCNISYSGTYV